MDASREMPGAVNVGTLEVETFAETVPNLPDVSVLYAGDSAPILQPAGSGAPCSPPLAHDTGVRGHGGTYTDFAQRFDYFAAFQPRVADGDGRCVHFFLPWRNL